MVKDTMIGGDGMGYFVQAESGVNLYVEDINPQSRKTIVFLHGWPLSHLQFEYQFDDLSQKGYRCIGIDWRGFGRRISRRRATITTVWLTISALSLRRFN